MTNVSAGRAGRGNSLARLPDILCTLSQAVSAERAVAGSGDSTTPAGRERGRHPTVPVGALRHAWMRQVRPDDAMCGWFREKGTAGGSAGPYALALYWLRERSAWFILVW